MAPCRRGATPPPSPTHERDSHARLARQVEDSSAHAPSPPSASGSSATCTTTSGARLLELVYSAPTPEYADRARGVLQQMRPDVAESRRPPACCTTCSMRCATRHNGRLHGTGIELHWEQDAALPNVLIDQGRVLHVLRIVREAISNALKHGSQHRLRMRIFSVADHMLLDVTDDGAFAPDAAGTGIGHCRDAGARRRDGCRHFLARRHLGRHQGRVANAAGTCTDADGAVMTELVPTTTDPGPRQSEAGTRLGAYRVVREIGRGGIGQVFLAERDDGQFRQNVAIKLLKRGMDTDAVLQRFRNERQILATLDHPNIARVIDGGAAPDGRPFLVMEYIDGVAITEYCRTRSLSLQARIELLLQLCDAVQHAHQRLLIHRDIKPSNVLVTAAGVPKLLDFGIAKLLVPGSLDGAGTVHTAEFHPLLTPGYASPEQVLGEPITTGTDVYGLGLLLSEIADGRPAAGGWHGDRRRVASRLRGRPGLARAVSCAQAPLTAT